MTLVQSTMITIHLQRAVVEEYCTAKYESYDMYVYLYEHMK